MSNSATNVYLLRNQLIFQLNISSQEYQHYYCAIYAPQWHDIVHLDNQKRCQRHYQNPIIHQDVVTALAHYDVIQ